MSRDDEAPGGVAPDTPGGRPPRAWMVGARLRAANDEVAHERDAQLPAHAELHCLSDFSFLRGASSAEALFSRARECGYEALAITDECSLAGIVRGWEAARETGVPLVVGSEIALADGPRVVLLVENSAGYAQLCELVTRGRRAGDKGRYRLTRADMQAVLRDRVEGLFALWLPAAEPDAAEGEWLRALFGERAYLAVALHRDRDDAARLAQLLALARQLDLVPVASGDVHMARRRDRIVQDTLTAIRHNLPLAECGAQLSGGYFYDAGFKEVPDIHRLGFPIVEMDQNGGATISKIAGTGGVIGVWPSAGTFHSLQAMAEGVKRMADVVGVAHVGLGTDMLGFISPPVFTGYEQLPSLGDALVAAGFTQQETGMILGGNYRRVFEATVV